jgi:hypothetical protein
MTKETVGTTQVPGASPQKQALLEAFDGVLKKQAEDREAERREAETRRRNRRQARPAIWASAALALFLCAYLYVERPEWLFPASAPPEPVVITEASLRIGMANVAQHIERYRQRTGKLPSTLRETGTDVAGITYQPVDSAAWRLSGSHAGIELVLTSGEPLARFIGNSFEMINRRPR